MWLIEISPENTSAQQTVAEIQLSMRVLLSMFSVSCATFITSTRFVKQIIIFTGEPVLKIILPGKGGGWGRGGGYSLVWPTRGCTAGESMVFVLSILNRVYDFVRVCPKQV